MRAVARVVGYDRVSTLHQAENGGSMDAQRERIRAEVERRGWELVEIIEDPARSGKNMRRPGMDRALEMVAAGEADAIVATKVDRVSRSVADFADLLARAGREGWHLVVLELGLDTTTAHGRFAAHMMAAVAELEREMIAARTREVLSAKRAAGTLKGPMGARGWKTRSGATSDEVRARIRTEREAGRSFRAIADGLNEDQVPTGQGGARWWPSTVRAVLASSPAEGSGPG